MTSRFVAVFTVVSSLCFLRTGAWVPASHYSIKREAHIQPLVAPLRSTPEKQGEEEKNGVDPTGDEAAANQVQDSIPPSPTSRELMAAMGTSPRRIALSFLSATGIALAGNFLGVTSNLLTLVPEDVVGSTGLDTYFPRGDYKRVNGPGYTCVIPKEWVADTFVALAKAQRQAGQLDYNMKRNAGSSTLPDAAFGPPGRLNKSGVSEQGETNMSVIVSSGLRGFSLQGTLESPQAAAETLLRVSLAPEGSGRTATLGAAEEDATRGVYQFEYDIDRGERGPPLRAISVIAAPSSSTLLTLTVVAPVQAWLQDETATKLRHVAESFHTI